MTHDEAKSLFERMKGSPPIAGPWETVLQLSTYRETPASISVYVAKVVRRDAFGQEVASVTQRGDAYFWESVVEGGKPMPRNVSFGEKTRIETTFLEALESADAHLRAVGYFPLGGFVWSTTESEPVED